LISFATIAMLLSGKRLSFFKINRFSFLPCEIKRWFWIWQLEADRFFEAGTAA
jgi:hypothetical protein